MELALTLAVGIILAALALPAVRSAILRGFQHRRRNSIDSRSSDF